MSDQHSTVTPPGSPATAADAAPATEHRMRTVVGHLAADATVAAAWAALVIAIVLFSGVVSQFAYVDF